MVYTLVEIIDVDNSETVTTSELRNALALCRTPARGQDIMVCKLKLDHMQHYLQTNLLGQLHNNYDNNYYNSYDYTYNTCNYH